MINESTHNRIKDSGYWYCVILDVSMTLLGIGLGTCGLWLLALGKSWYDLMGGLGFVISGTGLARTSNVGLWVYLSTYLFTLLGAFGDARTDWWSLLPRLFAPTALLVSVLMCISLMGPRGERHVRSRAATMTTFLVVATGTLSVVVGKVTLYFNSLHM